MGRMQVNKAARQAAMRAQNPNKGASILTGLPYFSRGRFTFIRSGTSPNFTFTLAALQIIKLFTFKQGEDMTAAGRPATTATPADTNLVVGGQTIDSEILTIHGLAIQVASCGAQSDSLAALHALCDLSVRIAYNGGKRSWDFGNVEMIPGANGLHSGGAAISAASGAAAGAMTNGMPLFSNYFPILGGMKWNPASGADSSLACLIQSERAIAFNVVNAAAPATVAIDLRAQLISSAKSKRSTNQ